MASSSRKAFWLLKSFNHVHTAIILIESYSHSADECYANLIDILEQLCLVVYYFYENLVFVARTKLVSYTEESLDWWGDWAWFFEDFTCFLAAALRTWISSRNLAVAVMDFKRLNEVVEFHTNVDDDHASCSLPRGPLVKFEDSSTTENHHSYRRTDTVDVNLAQLKKKYSDSLLTLAIVSPDDARFKLFDLISNFPFN